MTERGDPYENAIAERMNETFKVEYGLAETFESFDQTQEVTRQAIETYNNLRPHLSCGLMTPDQAHQQQAPLSQM